ncbi:2-oxoacid:acceptor oxidoreductase subunit alpha [Planctomycetota bacterium]|nr:2-oxoacid:acceptor oxidoreductase subunit alpha [Planctomycetota bacterium]
MATSAVETLTNDLVLHVATANGSGSQTSNMVLLRALMGMGIPVSGKNLFPSNIQGLPTWFTIRANAEGNVAHRGNHDIVVCMNRETAIKDAESVNEGGVIVYDAALKLQDMRPDCTHYAVPFKKLIAECCSDVRLRKLVINMLYVGVCAQLFNIDMDAIKAALSSQLAGKQKAIDINLPALDAGLNWAAENLEKTDRFRFERMGDGKGKVIIEGNRALALGMMYGGTNVMTWYPITPSSSVCEELEGYMNRFRLDENGNKTFAVVQAEDEIAAVGMLAGAGWGGARAFTATSGPGISLMNEIIGLGYYAEIPFVIANVARTGPSTGLPTRTMQGDVTSIFYASHGDTKHITVIPATPQEAFDFGIEAMNLAQDFQTPVFVLSDLDLGMNYWISDPINPPTEPLRRGKILNAEDLEKLKGDWGRYRDVDGDGIPYRTLPGTDHPAAAYFTRGTGHTPDATYSEDPQVWVDNMDRLTRKFNTAKTKVPKPIITGNGNKVGLLFFGTTNLAIDEACKAMESEHGVTVDRCRIRAFPFTQEIEDFIDSHESVYVIELNRDAQMRGVLNNEFPQFANKLESILHYDGMPLNAVTVTEKVLALLGK